MAYLVVFLCGLVLMNVLVMRRVRDISGVINAAVFISATASAIYQLINLVFFGVDPFFLIAAAVQFLIAFAGSVVFGIVYLKIREIVLRGGS